MSARTTLTATSRVSRRSRARNTAPMPPRPITASTRYFPSTTGTMPSTGCSAALSSGQSAARLDARSLSRSKQRKQTGHMPSAAAPASVVPPTIVGVAVGVATIRREPVDALLAQLRQVVRDAELRRDAAQEPAILRRVGLFGSLGAERDDALERARLAGARQDRDEQRDAALRRATRDPPTAVAPPASARRPETLRAVRPTSGGAWRAPRRREAVRR